MKVEKTRRTFGCGVFVLTIMRKQVNAILIHADAFLLGTLGEGLVQLLGHS